MKIIKFNDIIINANFIKSVEIMRGHTRTHLFIREDSFDPQGIQRGGTHVFSETKSPEAVLNRIINFLIGVNPEQKFLDLTPNNKEEK